MQKSLGLFRDYLTQENIPFVLEEDQVLFEYEHQGTAFLCLVASDDQRILEFEFTWDVHVPARMMDDVWPLMLEMHASGFNFGEIFRDSSTGQLSAGAVFERSLRFWRSEWISAVIDGGLAPFMELVDRVLQYMTGVAPRQHAIASYAEWCRKLRADAEDDEPAGPEEDDEPEDRPFWE